jgi:hypothetical protein
MLTRLDYGSATLAGLPNTLLNRLQSELHAATRLIYSERKYDHVMLLRDLHWLRVPERIAYRLAVLAFRCQHGTAPPYLSAELSPVAFYHSDTMIYIRYRSAIFYYHYMDCQFIELLLWVFPTNYKKRL